MGLFGSKKKEMEQAYMNAINVPECLKQDFTLTIDDVFLIVGIGTVATGTVDSGMCRVGESVTIYTSTGTLSSTITLIDIHTKDRKPNGAAYRSEHVGIGLRGIQKEQLHKGDKIIINNGNAYSM